MPDVFVKVAEKNLSAVKGALRFFDTILQAELKGLVQEHGLATRDLISFFAPVDTGFMQQHAEVRFTPKGYSWEAGYYADTFEAAGKRFYPPYQEWGTVNHGAQPSVGPAYDHEAPIFERDVADAIRRSVARSRRK